MQDRPESRAVLIVEDEPIQRMMLADIVEQAGFDAVEALDAEDAVRILESRPDIRIVFADIDMPGGIDGMKLAVTVRDRWPPIELIITSGKRLNLVAEDMPSRAVFCPKPYRRERLIETIQDLAGA